MVSVSVAPWSVVVLTWYWPSRNVMVMAVPGRYRRMQKEAVNTMGKLRLPQLLEAAWRSASCQFTCHGWLPPPVPDTPLILLPPTLHHQLPTALPQPCQPAQPQAKQFTSPALFHSNSSSFVSHFGISWRKRANRTSFGARATFYYLKMLLEVVGGKVRFLCHLGIGTKYCNLLHFNKPSFLVLQPQPFRFLLGINVTGIHVCHAN